MSRLQISPSNTSGRPASGTPGPQSSVATQHSNQAALPRLLPAPILRPTAYSARRITHTQVPSSPSDPVEDIPKPVMQDDVFRTPALPRQKRLASALQLSSPPDGQALRGGRLEDEEDNLTSSVVKGRAANDLLGLMRMGR